MLSGSVDIGTDVLVTDDTSGMEESEPVAEDEFSELVLAVLEVLFPGELAVSPLLKELSAD